MKGRTDGGSKRRRIEALEIGRKRHGRFCWLTRWVAICAELSHTEWRLWADWMQSTENWICRGVDTFKLDLRIRIRSRVIGWMSYSQSYHVLCRSPGSENLVPLRMRARHAPKFHKTGGHNLRNFRGLEITNKGYCVLRGCYRVLKHAPIVESELCKTLV